MAEAGEFLVRCTCNHTNVRILISFRLVYYEMSDYFSLN